MPGLGGDHLIQTTEEEHDALALAKRVIFALLSTDAATYSSPSLLVGTNGVNAMMVALGDPTTGSPLSVKNPGDLADGALSVTQTALYTATAKTWVTKIRCRNTGASTRIVTIAFRSSSTGTLRYPWPAATLLTHESVDFLADEGELGMSVGNILYGQQDAGTDVDYLISGEALS
jgi:hypothetical protein